MTKKWIAVILALGMSLGGLTGCNHGSESAPETSQPAQTNIADSGEKADLLFSKGFSITYLEDGVKKVTDGDNRELILVPQTLKKIPQAYENSRVIRTPVQNVVFLSTTQVCALRDAGDDILDSIGGVTGDAASWKGILAIRERIENGKILNVGNENGPDYEKIQALDPDIVFVYTGMNPQTEAIAKLEELGIPYAVDNDYMEDNYLARMEWIRFVLTFYDADAQVEKKMAEAKANVEAIKEQCKGKSSPKVAMFSVFNGVVYPTSDRSWIGSMMKDLGVSNVFSNLDNTALTLEEAYACIQEADVIIYTSTPAYTSDLAAVISDFPQLVECKAYQDDRLYQYSDQFWYGIDQTDQVAQEFAVISYPEVFKKDSLNYFIKLKP